ncbi:MAG: hypothetical protein ABI837_10995 [Acidobacteriota bacterium]
MPTDARSGVRIALLAGTMSLEPAPIDVLDPRVPSVRRIIPRVAPPLDLSVIPFRYRVRPDSIDAIRLHCAHLPHKR